MQQVAPGETVAVIESMKMEHALTVPTSATVKEVLTAPGQTVKEGERLIVLDN